MIVKVSTKGKEKELDRAIRTLRTYYQRAMDSNKIPPGFITNPLAWALYQTWRDVDARRERNA